MVKIKKQEGFYGDGYIDVEAWLEHLHQKHQYTDPRLIRNACMLSQLAGGEQATESGESCLQQGLAMADILVDLEMDQETIAAAIIYDSVQYAELSIDDVNEQLSDSVGKLVAGVQRMNAIHTLRDMTNANQQQLDNIRKMLLAMVDDVRVVIIKLSERLRVLRTIAPLTQKIQHRIAQEVMDIYAPLANRLGIGQIKWEMEDLAFRYLEPEQYKTIAKGLNERRVDRDHYVKQVIGTLSQALEKTLGKHFTIYGRSKHIHSIYRKMQRKNLSLSQIYDTTALRVLVPTIDDCYHALTTVHQLWEPITEEFDDYIHHPKANGYQSLHTAVQDAEGKHFEVQIRTNDMHEAAELGVAAHWKYKESAKEETPYERKITWLREVLAWHQDITNTEGITEHLETPFLEDRVYVFTPNGEIIDLPRGSTPLDFAYHIHTMVGHRCRGAKVNGHIVQLTTPINTGEQIEILTGKEAKPSRDWLNPHLHYVHTARAKSKIHLWFKQQDFDKNYTLGQHILDREQQKLGIKHIDLPKLAGQFNVKSADALLASLGAGDIRIGQLASKLQSPVPKPSKPEPKHPTPVTKSDAIMIEGVGNLLTHIAKCCQPIPGDPIIGYITLGRGISIHKQDCDNILHASEAQQQRLLKVHWSPSTQPAEKVVIEVSAYDRAGLLSDITGILSQDHTNVLSLRTQLDEREHIATMTLTISLRNLPLLSKLLDKIRDLPNIISVKRVPK